MRLSKEKTKELIEAIRGEIIKKPDATIFDIQQNLNLKYGHIYDKNFLGKLKNKIHKERSHRYNQITVRYEIAKLEDTVEELCRELWVIIDDEKSTSREKINAIREIRSSKSMLLETLFNSGIFEANANQPKKDGVLDEEEAKKIAQAISFAFNYDKPITREEWEKQQAEKQNNENML